MLRAINFTKRFKTFLLITIGFLVFNTIANAQQLGEDYRKSYFKLNVYGGADWLMRSKKSPYNNKFSNGFTVGASADKYWNKIGVGLDFLYAENQTQHYDDSGLLADLSTLPALNFTSSGTVTQRMTLTFGPTFRQDMFKKKMMLEVAVHGGYAQVKGGALRADINPKPFPPYNLYSDLGYAAKTYLPIVKGTLRLNYFIKPNFGIFAQGQYTKHFESLQPAIYTDRSTLSIIPFGFQKRLVEYEIDAISATLGLTYTPGRYKASENVTKEEKKTADKVVQKEVKVTALDDQTGIPLYNADVTLTDEAGNKATAKTGMDGVAIFPNLKPGAYTTEATLNNIKSTVGTVYKNDFDLPTPQIGVVVRHNDPRFTLLGFTTNKTTGQKEPNVLVKLTNEQLQKEDVLLSKGIDGEFLFQLGPNADYSVYGKKENYISNIEKVTTQGLNRSTTLYVKLEIGVEEVQMDKLISLKNIYYDLDKANVRADASTDLIKLIRFMEDNPNAKVEINSHTDSRGSDVYNLKLSQERANSVVNFLVNYGLSRNRLTAVGFGESRLINACRDGVTCSEADHQANRRTEFKVVR